MSDRRAGSSPLAGGLGLVFLLALELVDRIRVRDELEVARQLQADLLPATAPEIPGYRFTHAYRTANEIGGDYYDFHPLPETCLALTVGDASSHGMAAGLLMAIANATLETALDLDPAPGQVAALLNRALCRTGCRRAIMTLFYGLLGGRRCLRLPPPPLSLPAALPRRSSSASSSASTSTGAPSPSGTT